MQMSSTKRLKISEKPQAALESTHTGCISTFAMLRVLGNEGENENM